jgi:hypothetical protein
MSNTFYNHSDGIPVSLSRGSSSQIRAEFDLVQAGFDLLPSKDNLKHGTVTYAAADTGTADHYIVALPQDPGSLADGLEVVFKAANLNTGACDINVSNLGPVAIKLPDSTNPAAGDVRGITTVRYNITTGFFHLASSIAGATSAAASAAAASASAGTATGAAGTAVAAAASASASAAAAALSAASLVVPPFIYYNAGII